MALYRCYGERRVMLTITGADGTWVKIRSSVQSSETRQCPISLPLLGHEIPVHWPTQE
jgi:hypothetical protein